MSLLYRETRGGYENLSKWIPTEVDGKFSIPQLRPVILDTDNLPEFIGFNYARGCDEPELHGVHFYIDDYQFQRCWIHPDRYTEMLEKFDCVFTPDFSTYTDFPFVIQLYNHYRKHWLGAYWQMRGMFVIPTISWADEASFDWCFDGEPAGGAVSISSVGSQQSREGRENFLRGFEVMMDQLQPSQLVVHGKLPEQCDTRGAEIIKIQSFQEKMRERILKSSPKEV